MDNCVDEIVTSVRESSREAILDRFKFVDDLVIDPNGEPVDWLEGSISDPYLVTKFQGEGRDMWMDGWLGLCVVLKLIVAKVLQLEQMLVGQVNYEMLDYDL